MSKRRANSVTRGDRRLAPAALLAILVLLGLLWVWQQYGGGVIAPAITPTITLEADATRDVAATPSPPAELTPDDGLPTVSASSLPDEAQRTLALIDQGGPFPYRQDGSVFQNREGLLPDRPSGYYREYTAETPGAHDRGTRRIVTGQSGERYYTADHYQSFSRVTP